MAQIQRNVSLKNFSNFRIGGNAAYFLEADSKESLLSGLQEWKVLSKDFAHPKKIFVLSKGTNILFDDNWFDGLIIHCHITGLQQDATKLTVGSGVLISEITSYCIEHSLSGMEWAGGLPGTIGGAIRGNAGAFGGEIKDVISEVKSINLQTLEEKKRSVGQCQFDYRNSIFKMDAAGELITAVTLQLQTGNQEMIREKTKVNIDYRKAKHPLEYPNIGSIFKNVPFAQIAQNQKEKFASMIKTDPFPVIPTAKILITLNLKGKRIGDAMVSEKHPNYIVNMGNATAADVKALINEIKKAVFSAYGITLEEEVMFV